MKIINYSEARTKLRSVLDEVDQTNEPTFIISKNNQVVVLSKDMYELMIAKINGDKND